MSKPLHLHIRPAVPADIDFILSLVPRLTAFGLPPWRDAGEMIAVDTQVLTDKLTHTPQDTVILVAEDEHNTPLGFIHLQTGNDYYHKVKHGHIADIIVSAEAEGLGIGRALMQKAEEWACAEGFRWLTLGVFAQNTRAREFYTGMGYSEDLIKYGKQLL